MKRSTLILVALLCVLSGLAYWVMQRPGEQSQTTASGKNLIEVDSARVDGLEIRGPAGSVRLERRGMEWFVVSPVNARANATAVANALSQAADLRVKSVVSSKPEKHTLFQVDSASGTWVTVFEGGSPRAGFVVGKMAAGYTDTYARAASSDEVAVVAGSFSWTFNRPVRDWRDKAILTLARPDVKDVTYQYGDTTFTLALLDSAWRVDGKPANAQTVETLLNSLSALQCDDFIDDPAKAKLVATISVSGQQVRFSREAGQTRYLVQTSAGPQWYVLEAWRAESVLKRKKELL